MGEGAGGGKEYRQIAATMKGSSGGAMPNPMSLFQSVGVNVNGQQQHRKTNAGRSVRRRHCGGGNGSCELSRMYKGLVDGGGEGIMC